MEHFRCSILYGTGINPIDLVSSDFDGDDKLDIANVNYDTGNISFCLETEGDPLKQRSIKELVLTHME
ncbi:MAG: hypothetical protein MRQ09_00205 [Candidatus Midichloria sp.]|nr:hypothetical protein [Candidatus Midichloria sp.]